LDSSSAPRQLDYLSALDRPAQCRQFLLRNLTQPFDRRLIRCRRGQQQRDLVEIEPGALRRVDHGQGAEHAAGVAPLVPASFRDLEQAQLLVVTDRRRSLAGQARDVADRQ
jgi:hypothetical protein